MAICANLQGSAFELKVWQALRDIPAGTTTTYGEIAARVGSPRGSRSR
jgi:AraC family transcriptional regulator of adaptative response/methylated-DNA-[protein]-cysteine methyltransferase